MKNRLLAGSIPVPWTRYCPVPYVGRATMGNIRQNLFFAFIYNSLGVPVAAGVLYPVFGILLSPVITNSLRLKTLNMR